MKFEFLFSIFIHNLIYLIGNKRFPNHISKAKVTVKSLQNINSSNQNTKPMKLDLSSSRVHPADLILPPRIDIFVRKYSVGFWTRIKGLKVEDEILHLLQQYNDEFYDDDDNNDNNNEREDNNDNNNDHDKMSSEQTRNIIDKKISKILFGEGLGGEKDYVLKLKNSQPQLKKLKPKEFEFGYKYVSDLPDVENSNIIYSLRSEERDKAEKKSLDWIEYNKNQIIVMDKSADYIMERINNTVINGSIPDNNFSSIISSVLDHFLKKCCHNSYREFLVSCDGGAVMFNDTCTSASAGVCIIPMDSNLKSNPNCELLIRIHSLADLVCTPFDSELIAGLVAVSFIRSISEFYNSHIQTSTSSSVELNAKVITDSKTLCRVFRLLRDDCDASDARLFHRGKPIRNVVWRLMRTQLSYLNTSNSSIEVKSPPGMNGSNFIRSNMDLKIDWICGHPERRKSREEWSVADKAIYTADVLTSVDGMSGKLAVRNVDLMKSDENPNKNDGVTSTQLCVPATEFFDYILYSLRLDDIKKLVTINSSI